MAFDKRITATIESFIAKSYLLTVVIEDNRTFHPKDNLHTQVYLKMEDYTKTKHSTRKPFPRAIRAE